MAKVFLSAGHGGSDPGAVANGLREKDVNLNTLLACRDELTRHGVDVICSRTTDANDPVAQEVKEANVSGADIAVSFHANAGGGNGFEAYYHTSNNNGRYLAGLCEKYVKALGQNSRGLKSGNHLYFIKNTKITSILVESFFVDNVSDKTIGDTTAEQRAFGVAYAKAILEYFGITYKTGSTITSKEYKVKVSIPDLNIRKGPGTNYEKTGKYTGKGVFTIIEEAPGSGSTKGWGKLKSGVGWISLDYVTKI